jgi:uncharacterized alpha-E superfamily protein
LKKRFAYAVGLTLALSVYGVGCGDDDDGGDVADANAEYCEDLNAYLGAVEDAEALDPATASKDDYEDALEAVESARIDVSESQAELSESQWENLEQQTEDLREQLQDAPDDEAVASILEEAKPQFQAVVASAATVNTAVCGGGTTTTAG